MPSFWPRSGSSSRLRDGQPAVEELGVEPSLKSGPVPRRTRPCICRWQGAEFVVPPAPNCIRARSRSSIRRGCRRGRLRFRRGPAPVPASKTVPEIRAARGSAPLMLLAVPPAVTVDLRGASALASVIPVVDLQCSRSVRLRRRPCTSPASECRRPCSRRPRRLRSQQVEYAELRSRRLRSRRCLCCSASVTRPLICPPDLSFASMPGTSPVSTSIRSGTPHPEVVFFVPLVQVVGCSAGKKSTSYSPSPGPTLYLPSPPVFRLHLAVVI